MAETSFVYSINDLTNSTSIVPQTTIQKTTVERNYQEVQLENEFYNIDLTKFSNISLIYIDAKFNENSIVSPSVAIGDTAEISVTINAGTAINHEGTFIMFPTSAITSITVQAIDARKVLFKILIMTKA